MIVDCAHYKDGHRTDEGKVPLAEIADRCAQGGFVWLGLFEPGAEELAQVRETFGLHELAVEDALTLHRHPKLVTYDGVQLVIMRTARYDDEEEEVDFGEISVFVAPTFVITVRQGVAADLIGVRQQLEERPELLAAGSSSVLWSVLDAVVDTYAPVVLEVERDVDDIEATVFSGAIAPTERIYSLRGEATGFYRAVHPLLAVVSAVEQSAPARGRASRSGRAMPAGASYLTSVSFASTAIRACYPRRAGQCGGASETAANLDAGARSVRTPPGSAGRMAGRSSRRSCAELH